MWSATLDGGQTRSDAALSLLLSQEGRNRLIARAYDAYLQRMPLPQETDTFRNALVNNQMSETQFVVALVGSDEYFATQASLSNATWIDQAYQDLLGRPVDPGGQAYWLGALGSGMTRSNLASAIFSSAEGRHYLVRSLFNRYLQRVSSSVEEDTFTQFLQAGGTPDQVRATILASQEYFARSGTE